MVRTNYVNDLFNQCDENSVMSKAPTEEPSSGQPRNALIQEGPFVLVATTSLWCAFKDSQDRFRPPFPLPSYIDSTSFAQSHCNSHVTDKSVYGRTIDPCFFFKYSLVLFHPHAYIMPVLKTVLFFGQVKFDSMRYTKNECWMAPIDHYKDVKLKLSISQKRSVGKIFRQECQ